MPRDLPDEIFYNVKDRIRDVRHFMRAGRHDTPGGPRHLPLGDLFVPPAEIGRLLSRAVSLIDDTLTAAESVSKSLVPAVRTAHGPGLQGYGAYFPAGESSGEGERQFRRDFYGTLRSWLRKNESLPLLLHEASLAQAHLGVRRRHADILAAMNAAGQNSKIDAVAAVVAATLVELAASKSLLSDTAKTETSAIQQLLASMALACGLLTLSTSDWSDALAVAEMAVEARLHRIAHALDSADPVTELTRIFRGLLVHLG